MTEFKSDIITLLRCMIAMASADERLREQEVEVIATIYKKLMNQPIDPGRVRELFELARRNEQTWLFDDLAAFENLDMEMKRLIVKACYMVQISDREATEEELETLAGIAAAMQLSEDKLVEIVREVSRAGPSP